MADPTTPRLLIPYPLLSDPANVPAGIQNAVEQIDSLAAIDMQGTYATMTALTGVATGTYFWTTDLQVLYRYNGSAWNPVQLGPSQQVSDLAEEELNSGASQSHGNITIPQTGMWSVRAMAMAVAVTATSGAVGMALNVGGSPVDFDGQALISSDTGFPFGAGNTLRCAVDAQLADGAVVNVTYYNGTNGSVEFAGSAVIQSAITATWLGPA